MLEGAAATPRLDTEALKRAKLLAEVQKHGGSAAGIVLSRRQRLRRLVESLPWVGLILLGVLIDIIVLILEFAVGSEDGNVILLSITTAILFGFWVDVILRIWVYRRLFFCSVWGWFDLIIMILSTTFLIIDFVTIEDRTGFATGAVAIARGGKALRGLILTVRSLRAARVAAHLTRTGRGTKKAARLVTGENKRRFVDLEHDFDLDLVYIEPTLIAMSVPATGRVALYRNPLSEVARFFETRHGTQGYTIVNLCPELPYPTKRFKSGTVTCFDVQDHTPPTMAQFVQFLNLCREAPPEHLLAVHCRGGKGRTGSLCCAWLLYTRTCSDADDALTLFALERTELALGKRKLQGVETPSQRRYVMQVDAMLRSQGHYLRPEPSDELAGDELAGDELVGGPPKPPYTQSAAQLPPPVGLPPSPSLKLDSLALSRWFASPPDHPLVCAVHVGGKVVHWSPPVPVASLTCAEGAAVRFQLSGVEVRGDLRVSVFDLTKLLKARKERVKRRLEPRLPFDGAAVGPWDLEAEGGRAGDVEMGAFETGGASGADGGGAVTSHSDGRGKSKRVIAGKEAGCLFYFLLHSGFIGPSCSMAVPLQWMDKACKNKGGRYDEAGVATLACEAPGGYCGLTVSGEESGEASGEESGGSGNRVGKMQSA